ncbi:MAG: hypothetical protein HY321_10060 [Armatimonadetes bacterium]|nr:hypothetical protein [Armatimonadota bacterium]
MRLVIGLAAAVALLLGVALEGTALPQYAAKEGKPCSYCHVKPEGGKDLNEAGKYYKSHGHSLKGYKPGKQSKPKTAPKSPKKKRK